MVKEVASYEKEAKDNEKKVQQMRDDGKDAYDIRKQEEVGGRTSCQIQSEARRPHVGSSFDHALIEQRGLCCRYYLMRQVEIQVRTKLPFQIVQSKEGRQENTRRDQNYEWNPRNSFERLKKETMGRWFSLSFAVEAHD